MEEAMNIADQWGKRTPCDCEICRRSRRWREIRERGDVREMDTLIEELTNALIDTEEELAMQKADRRR
jgi:hypothetical protein